MFQALIIGSVCASLGLVLGLVLGHMHLDARPPEQPVYVFVLYDDDAPPSRLLCQSVDMLMLARGLPDYALLCTALVRGPDPRARQGLQGTPHINLPPAARSGLN
jgi:hypothetical protein